MKNPALVVEGALASLQTLGAAAKNAGVPTVLLDLVYLRASQINGCAWCVDMHARDLRKHGESDDRLFGVAAWRESPFFSPAERAALELTEATTRIADKGDPVPDDVWEEVCAHFDERGRAALVLNIAMINLWNRLNVATRQVVAR